MAPKKKQEKMGLGEFLTDQSLGSWADEMDSQPVPAAGSGYGRDRDGGERRGYTQPAWETARTGSGVGGGVSSMAGGMGGRVASYERAGYAVREQLPMPTAPPFTAHLGNLAYDVSQAEIHDFLKDCQVTSVRIVEDKLDHKPKGFGYVEFGTLDGLKTALTLTETDLMGRRIKISVAEPTKDRQEQSRDFSDWSRKGPLPDLPQNTRQPSNRGFRNAPDNMSDAGSERGGSRRGGFYETDSKPRDFSNWERKGPLAGGAAASPAMRDGGRLREGGAPLERHQSPAAAWGEGKSDAGSRPPRKEFEPRPLERAPTAAEQDTQWRARMKKDASPAATPEGSAPTSPQQQQPQAPKERPRLNLQKRTVSNINGEGDAAGSVASEAKGSDAKASPFGAARPIDTSAREREVEEKRQLAVRQKKEADDQAREEKMAKEAAARAARAEKPQTAAEEKVTSPTTDSSSKTEATKGPRRPFKQQNGLKSTGAKENGENAGATRPSFSILRRDTEGGEDETSAAAATIDKNGSNANGQIVDKQQVKAQETTRTVAPAGSGDANEGAPQASDPPPTPAMEDEGWATVASKPKNSRRGGSARAIAS